MQIPVSILFAIALSLNVVAAPVPNVDDESALEMRAAKKVAAKPAAVKAAPKPPVKAAPKPVPVKAAPVPVKAAAKPAPPLKAPVKPSPVKAAPVPSKAAAKPAPPVKAPAKAAPVKAVPVPAKAAPKPVKAPAKAAPVKAAPVPAKAAPKPPVKAPTVKPVSKTAAKPVASAKPSKLPLCTPAQVEARELEERASVSHPSGTGTVSLFHGASSANANALASSKVDLSKTRGTGDFNHRPEVPGGFYMSDSLVAAAQFACFGIPGQKPAAVDVLQFKWSGAGVNVHQFPGETADWRNFQIYNSNPNPVVDTKSPFASLAAGIYKSAMITGPLNGPVDFDLTDSFQQYAVVSQEAADNNLSFQQHFKNILCKNIPKGNEVTPGLYAQGQAGNAKFNTRLAKLQDPEFQPGGGKCVIQ
ncbi:hypothetical protein DFH07DRAFT_967124 [Mycena maculata]|uniref:Uncharacterized protein n=1 Tax=Mycena maculata TaxID=230809 RepID=A0AAD7I5M2_9AGAR|nr:hypothetical protein DFH07DRAFT_967124 [Mycena maculata]